MSKLATQGTKHINNLIDTVRRRSFCFTDSEYSALVLLANLTNSGSVINFIRRCIRFYLVSNNMSLPDNQGLLFSDKKRGNFRAAK